MSIDTIITVAKAIWVDPTIAKDNVAVVFNRTGEVVWIPNDDFDEDPSGDYDEVGYDPFTGCYTDDC